MAEYAKRRGADVGAISTPATLSSLYQPQMPPATVAAQMNAPQMVAPATQQVAAMAPAPGYSTSTAGVPTARFPTAGGDALRARLGGAPVPADGMPMRREPGGVPVSVNPFASTGMPAARAAAPMADRAAQMTGGAQMPANLPEYRYTGDAFAKLPPGQQAMIDAEIRRKMMGQAFAGQQQAVPASAPVQTQMPALGAPAKMR